MQWVVMIIFSNTYNHKIGKILAFSNTYSNIGNEHSYDWNLRVKFRRKAEILFWSGCYFKNKMTNVQHSKLTNAAK